MTNKKLYEAMFLVDSAEAASEWDRVERNIRTVLERTDAEIVSLKKWDTRNLAYEVKGQIRGTYVLCYFRGDGKRNQDIERAVQLSEQIVRVLILCAEGREEDAVMDTPALLAEKAEREVRQRVAESAEAEPVSSEGDPGLTLPEAAAASPETGSDSSEVAEEEPDESEEFKQSTEDAGQA
jgi:small subunit ribosomal protein S6